MTLLLSMDADPGTFYDVPGGFFLPTKHVAFQTVLNIEQRLPVSCMVDIFLAHLNGERVGFYFTTRFEILNGGGYLITSLHNKGKATAVEVLIKTVDLVVYNYPNKGTLIVSPLVSDEILRIYEDQ